MNTGAILLLTVVTLGVDDVTDRFTEVFGDRIREVRATAASDDDVALARSLVDAAQRMEDAPEMIEPMTLAAYDLSRSDPAAYRVGLEALELREKQSPERSADCLDKRIDLIQAAMSSVPDERREIGPQLVAALEARADLQIADDPQAAISDLRRAIGIARAVDSPESGRLQQKMRDAAEVLRWSRRVDLLKSQLKRDPENKDAASELATILITKLDRPDRAAKYSFLLQDPLQRRVVAAARPVETLSAADRHELAEWYESLAGREPEATRAPLLRRAIAYVRACIDTADAAEPLVKAKWEVALTRLNAQLASLDAGAGAPTGGDGWVDLLGPGPRLPGWQTGNDKESWKLERGVLSLSGKADLFHEKVSRDFEVKFEVKPTPRDETKIYLRSNDASRATLIVVGGTVRFKEFDAARGVWKRPIGKTVDLPAAPADGFYEFEISAIGERLKVSVNGQEVADIELDASLVEPGRFGLGTWNSEPQFRRVRMKQR